MAEKVSWIKNGNRYQRVEGNVANMEQIPQGIYKINFHPMQGWSLSFYADAFTFDYKIYGLEEKFYDHVLKAYEHTKGNFGVLMNGIKGTGKSVTSKLLANAFKLPIIIVEGMDEQNQAMFNYISSFNFDCVLFLDEFEKNFSKEDTNVLQIMDGVYTSKYRRIFLLTTNETYINDNLISRPSRLRYIHQFGNLDINVAKAYLEDNLNDKSAIPELLDFIDTLSISTIDILKSVTEEVNIFGIEEFLATKHYFNVRSMNFYYDTKYIFIGINKAKEMGYNVSNFLADIKYWDDYNSLCVEPGETTEQFLTRKKKFGSEHKPMCDYLPNFDAVTSDKNFKNLKQHDDFDNDDVILVDKTHNVVVTAYNSDTLKFSLILNPEEKPSLYKTYSRANYLTI